MRSLSLMFKSSCPNQARSFGNFLIFTLLFTVSGHDLTQLSIVALCLLFRSSRLQIVAIGNLAFQAFALSDIAQFWRVGASFNASGISSFNHWSYAGLYLVSLAFFFTYAVASIRLFPKAARTWAPVILIALVMLFVHKLGAALHLPNYFLLLLVMGCLYNAFYIRLAGDPLKNGWADFLASQTPFFSQQAIPTPPVLGLELRKDVDESRLNELQLSGIKMMVLVTAFSMVRRYFIEMTKSSFMLNAVIVPRPGYASGLFHYADFHFSTGEIWWLTILVVVEIVLQVMTAYGSQVAICRMMGVDLKSPIYDVTGAKTFFQFLERLNHYYCRLIIDLFIPPCMQIFGKVRSYTTRGILALSLAILICGIAYHDLRQYYFVLLAPRNNGADLSYTAYWLIIATVTAISLALERRRHIRFWTNAPLLRFTVYLFLHATLLWFVKDFESGHLSFHERLEFFLMLFGIPRN